MATAEADDLITEVTHLPVLPGAAMRLLWMVEDPRASGADLGRLIESDAVLSTHIIGLADTPFYGLAGKVSSAWRAVAVLGRATVRAIATAAAFDLFSSGLLHDLGAALVFRRAPRRCDAVLDLIAGDPTLSRMDAERMEFGVTHVEVGAAALSVMRFPADIVEAIGSHHAPPAQVTSPLGRVLVAADAVAIEIDNFASEQNAALEEALEALEMPAGASAALVAEVRADQENLAGFLTAR